MTVRVQFNGVDGTTGRYLEAGQTSEDFVSSIVAPRDARLKAKSEKVEYGTLDLPFDVDPLDPTRAGWAIVASDKDADKLHDALLPLFEYRHAAIGDRARFLKYSGQPRETWLASLGVADSDINPEAVPYYLLLAGDTASIPFSFAHDLAVDYAVGRLELDSVDEYRAYAERLVEYEKRRKHPQTARRVAFFGPRHEDDGATQLSADYLLAPLSDPEDPRTAVRRTGYTPTRDIGDTATKQRLAEILCETDAARPSVLFTASHGIAFPHSDADQKHRQGALLCQDWPGPGVIDENFYFSADDVPADANVAGLISFHFACYSAGTPERDRFAKRNAKPAKILADQPFIAALPKELLRRGALAVVGHVDRAWGYSIISPEVGKQIQSFDNFLGRVLLGQPVGHAMRDFAHKYASHSTSLTTWMEKAELQKVPSELLVRLWTQRNDAGAYLVVGDPLACLHRDATAKETKKHG